ncbi:kinesin-like protein KIF25 [Ciona intestinalis]
MPLKFNLENFTNTKVQTLERKTLRQQEEIAELKRQNALLHLRLAQALQTAQSSREETKSISSLQHKQAFNVQCSNKHLEQTQSELQHVREELEVLSSDVVSMFCNLQHSCSNKLEVVQQKVNSVKMSNEANEALQVRLHELHTVLEETQALHLREKHRRRELHNNLVEIRGNIRVQCRLRPYLEYDKDPDSVFPDAVSTCSDASEKDISVYSTDDETISVDSDFKPQKYFEYERVYGPVCSQNDIFDEIQPILTSFLDGYNACVVAYGQTGSGKTHTMLGNPHNPGIVPNSMNELFRLIEEKSTDSISLEVSVAEVYNNDIYDLLSDNPKQLKHDIVTTRGSSRDVPTLTQIKVKCPEDVESLMRLGLNRRAQIATNVHEHSSRSHLIVTVTAIVCQHDARPQSVSSNVSSEPNTPRRRPSSVDSAHRVRRKLPQPTPPIFASTPNLTTDDVIKSVPASPVTMPTKSTYKTKLQLVDLAGSECVGMSGVTGSALRESSFINRSLSALSDVLTALSERRSHIPYRNSKLTHLLQDSIGGDAKMMIMLCVSPTRKYLTETMQTLQFGSRARQVQRGPPRKRGTSPHATPRGESPMKPSSPRQIPQSVVRRVFN